MSEAGLAVTERLTAAVGEEAVVFANEDVELHWLDDSQTDFIYF